MRNERELFRHANLTMGDQCASREVFVFYIRKERRKLLPTCQASRSRSREVVETLLQRSLIPTENWHDRYTQTNLDLRTLVRDDVTLSVM